MFTLTAQFCSPINIGRLCENIFVLENLIDLKILSEECKHFPSPYNVTFNERSSIYSLFYLKHYKFAVLRIFGALSLQYIKVITWQKHCMRIHAYCYSEMFHQSGPRKRYQSSKQNVSSPIAFKRRHKVLLEYTSVLIVKSMIMSLGEFINGQKYVGKVKW